MIKNLKKKETYLDCEMFEREIRYVIDMDFNNFNILNSTEILIYYYINVNILWKFHRYLLKRVKQTRFVKQKVCL